MKKLLIAFLTILLFIIAMDQNVFFQAKIQADTLEEPMHLHWLFGVHADYQKGPFPDYNKRLDYRYLDYSKSRDFELIDHFEDALSLNQILSNETGHVTWQFELEEAGYYNLRLRYFPIEGRSGSIERFLYINNQSPFERNQPLIFKRIWRNSTNIFQQDINGNDITPRQIEAPRWIETEIYDPQGFYSTSLFFFFEAGVNTITLESVREPILIDYLDIYQAPQIPTYEDYLEQYLNYPNFVASNSIIRVQGQHMHEKTAPTLYPVVDRTSPRTSPQHHAKLRLNAGGGMNYRVVGDWISYEVEIPASGFYHLSLIYKQTYLRGAYVTRSVKINGEIPFQEMQRWAFNYSNWNLETFGSPNPYLIYLDQGTHEIAFEVSLGAFAQPIQDVEKVIEQLNSMYRQIVMITSTNPDRFRDYLLPQRLPQLLPTFKEQLNELNRVMDDLYAVTGDVGDQTAALRQMVVQIEGFIESPQTIHQRLSEYQNNVSALGAWVLNIKEQPLLIDQIILHSPEASLPRAQANIFERIWFEIRSFLASFYVDYNALNNTSTFGDDSITVWVGSGRDQANIIRRLIDESFTPTNGISVNLQLVQENVLLPATFTNSGPDVMLGVGNTTPVNFAMRNAALDLSQFNDSDIVLSAFKESAIMPYRFEGGIYAMPEQQIFPVLFYREDILKEIGILPEDYTDAFWDEFTWDDVIDMIPELQRLNLEFYLPIDIVEQQLGGIIPPNLIYVSLLYQSGGELYTTDGSRTLLQEQQALETFRVWSDFYTNYRFTIQANFVNRFRTGEMPIGIAYYTTYNVLSVFAPEINGNWRFTLVPGTRQEDGTINRAVPSTGTASMILNQTQNKDAAWEFIKWWGSTDIQVQFGREMEGIMGAAARYPTANVAALERLPWPSRDIAVLKRQWEEVRGIPEFPGSYITGRHLDNALRRVVNTGSSPRETLYEFAELINIEISSKRREFGLD